MPNAKKHPGQQNSSLQEISESTGKGKLSDLAYWKDLSGQEQVFLGHYVYYRDIGLAARTSGVGLDWVTNKCKVVKGFQEMLDYVMEYPKELAKAIAEEALPRAAMRMRNVLETSENPQVIIKVSKQLTDMVLLLGDKPWFSNGASTFNQINIQSFDAPQEPENVIDGKVVEG